MPAIPHIILCVLVACVLMRSTQQESADKICATDDRSVTLTAGMGEYMTPVGRIKFQVVCNEQKNAIKRCIVTGSDNGGGGKMSGLSKLPPDGFPASREPTKFGGDLGNRYQVDCSESEAPKRLLKKWYSEQVCDTPSQSDVFKVAKIPKPFTIVFACNAAKTHIESCKPDGLFGSITAGSSPSWFGGPFNRSYKLKCYDQNPPEFP